MMSETAKMVNPALSDMTLQGYPDDKIAIDEETRQEYNTVIKSDRERLETMQEKQPDEPVTALRIGMACDRLKGVFEKKLEAIKKSVTTAK